MYLYGTGFKTNTLLTNQDVSTPAVVTHKSHFLTITRTLLVVGELAVSFGLDFITAGAATPFSQLAVGELFGAANEYLDVKQGYLSGINTALNFGIPFISLGGIAKVPKQLREGLTQSLVGIDAKASIKEAQEAKLVDEITNLNIRYAKKVAQEEKINQMLERTQNYENSLIDPSITKGELYDDLSMFNFDDTFESGNQDYWSDNKVAWRQKIYRSRKRRLHKLFEDKFNIEDRIYGKQKQIEEIQSFQKKLDIAKRDTEKLLNNIPKYSTKYSIAQTFKRIQSKYTIAGLAGHITEDVKPLDIVRKFTTKKYSPIRLTDAEKELMEAHSLVLNNITKVLSGDKKKIWEQLIDPRTRIRDLNPIIERFFNMLDPIELQAIKDNTGNLKQFLLETRQPAITTRTNKWVKRIQYLGSQNYYRKVVKKLQIVRSVDAGKEPLEALYRVARAHIKRIRDINARALAKIKVDGKSFKTIQNEWEKEGGVWLGGEYVLGYKVVPDTRKALRQLVIIKFNPLTTAAINKVWNGRETNNYKGKKDVVVEASDRELKKLTMYGGAYYNRRWARSEGGRGWLGEGIAHAIGVPINNNISLFLNVFPVNAIRYNVALLHNFVNTGYQIGTGQYVNKYLHRFTRSMVRAAIVRPIRLLTRYGLPRQLQNSFLARSTISRVSSGIISSSISPNDKYILKFKKPTNLGNVLGLKLAQGGRTFVNRSTRKHGGNVGLKTYQNTRKFNQSVRRLPTSFIPKGTYNSRNFLKFKLK